MGNAAKKKNKKKKPLRRAQRWQSRVLPMAGKMLVPLIAIIVMGLMFSALQAVGHGLRVVLALAIIAGMLLFLFSEGLNRGAEDAAASRSYVSLSAKGMKLDEKDDAMCYHPLKALCAVMAVFIVPLALACVVALTAKGYTYSLQDLPTWLTESYGMREDVMGPLGAYTAQQGMAAQDWLRLIVRLFVMNYINLFDDPLTTGFIIDRLSPLFILSYPAVYMIGYLRGPASNRKLEKMNRRAKKVAVRKAEKRSLAEELTGAQTQVHYGHKKEEHKKKVLI
ncbi:MAG: hypothetical protein IKJ11_09630 [Clostridia bacterium]|nr:hypothetical protein [Clostridia bacterium]